MVTSFHPHALSGTHTTVNCVYNDEIDRCGGVAWVEVMDGDDTLLP